jgi:adenine-specific DNA-methyltransferase
VLELNAQDGGKRQFILCTNNENGIAEKVTYPRIAKVIEKMQINDEVRYFKTDFVAAPELGSEKNTSKRATDATRFALRNKCADMLKVKEGTFCREPATALPKTALYAIYTDAAKTKYTVIIFETQYIEEAKKAVKDVAVNVTFYLFTLGYDLYEEDFDFSEHPNWSAEPIPEPILNVYRKVFAKRKKRK